MTDFGPFLFFWKIIKSSCKKIWVFCKWLTKHEQSTLAPFLFYILVAAFVSKPLFGNTFSLDGWKNAFDEPWGFVIFSIPIFAALLLIVSKIRSRVSLASPEWERRYLKGLWPLIVIGLTTYFLFYALQSHFPEDNNGTTVAAQPVNHTADMSQINLPDKTTKSLVLAEADLTGTQGPSIKFLDLHPNQKIQIEVLRNDLRSVDKSGGWHNLTPWGYEDPKIASCQDDWWNAVIPYSHVSGVKCGEVVVLLREKPMQFPDGKKSMIVENSSSTGSASVVLYINNPKEYWWDSQCESKYIFPTRSEAKKYGCLDAQRYDAFVPGSYTGAMHFRATTVN